MTEAEIVQLQATGWWIWPIIITGLIIAIYYVGKRG